MKLRLPLLFFFIILSSIGTAQVGIGTTNPSPSSMLDIVSSDKGILIPRVDLQNLNTATPITNPEKSMLVWNTDASGGGANEGFYYWTGSAWGSLSKEGTGSSIDSWSQTGNTVNGDKFIGTKNWSAFNTRVNNNLFSSFSPNGGLSIGFQSQANVNNSIAIGTSANASASNQATAVGPESTASGFQSAAFGYQAKALNNNSTLALGHSAVASSFQATAIGHNSRASSNNNALAIGTNSSATGQNSTAIGTNASVTQNNAVVIGDINNANVGIGTSTPNTNAKLDVNGNFKLGNRGSVQKNMISFSQGRNLGTIPANGSNVIEITIPTNSRPSSTTATLIVTPDNGMDDNIHIAWTKLKDTNVVRIKLVNTSANTFHNPYVNFHITMIEF